MIGRDFLLVARDVEGRVLDSLFDRPAEPEFVDHYGVAAALEEAEEDAQAAQEALKQLAALGYIEEAPSDDRSYAGSTRRPTGRIQVTSVSSSGSFCGQRRYRRGRGPSTRV